GDLPEGDVDVARGDRLEHSGPGRKSLDLRLDVGGDVELGKQSRNECSARSTSHRIDVPDRFGGEKRALEGVDRSDLRSLGALARKDADSNPGDIGFAAGDDLPLLL